MWIICVFFIVSGHITINFGKIVKFDDGPAFGVTFEIPKHLHKPRLYQFVQFSKLLLAERNQLL